MHLLVLSGFSLFGTYDSSPQPVGFVEVEFGPLSEGQPVEQSREEPAAPQRPALEPQPEPETNLQEEQIKAQPLDLPDQAEEIAGEEQVQTTEQEEVDVETPGPAADEQEAEEEVQAPSAPESGGGTPEGSSGRAEGEEGEGTNPDKAAPFKIEGLNRVSLSSPLPRYAEKVNATIKIRITVDPKGRVVQRVPLMKGNPQLEESVMSALQRWRFNPLPANAPQENQTGVITFRFRLE